MTSKQIFKIRFKKFKILLENKQSNFYHKLSTSQKLLFEKLQNGVDEDASEFDKKSKRCYRQVLSSIPEIVHPQTVVTQTIQVDKDMDTIIDQEQIPQRTKKKKRRKNKDVPPTRADIFEHTPKMERTLNMMIPYALSPPNFSSLKMDKDFDECEKVEDKQEYLI